MDTIQERVLTKKEYLGNDFLIRGLDEDENSITIPAVYFKSTSYQGLVLLSTVIPSNPFPGDYYIADELETTTYTNLDNVSASWGQEIRFNGSVWEAIGTFRTTNYDLGVAISTTVPVSNPPIGSYYLAITDDSAVYTNFNEGGVAAYKFQRLVWDGSEWVSRSDREIYFLPVQGSHFDLNLGERKLYAGKTTIDGDKIFTRGTTSSIYVISEDNTTGVAMMAIDSDGTPYFALRKDSSQDGVEIRADLINDQYIQQLPPKSGTIALLSDITGGFVPYTGATADVDLGDHTIDVKRILQSNNGGSVFIGEGAGLNDDLSNNLNVFIGKQSGYENVEGLYNTAIGAYSHYYNIEGMSNVAIGYFSLLKCTKNDNVAIGVNSIKNSIDGFRNTAIGNSALEFFTDGNNNVAIGFNAGKDIITGIGNILIGGETNLKNNSSNDTNEVVIGANAIGNGSNTATIGDDNVTDFYAGEDGQAKVHAGSAFFGDSTLNSGSTNYATLKIDTQFTEALSSGAQLNFYSALKLNNSDTDKQYQSTYYNVWVTPTDTSNYTGILAGMSSITDHEGSGELRLTYGMRGQVRNWENGAILDARGIEGVVLNEGTGTITDAYGIVSDTNTGLIENSYGIYVESQIAGSVSNYAIYTNAGKVRFGDEMTSTSAKIGNVTAGNYLEIDTTGQVRLYGDATQWEDLRVPVVSTKAAGSKDPAFQKILDNGSASQGVFSYRFDPSTEEELYFTVQLPHSWKQGSDIEAHVHWIPITDGTEGKDVCWGLEYTWASVGEVFGNTTIIYGDVNHLGETLVANKHYLTELGAIDATDKTFSSMLMCRVFRDATSSGGIDDYTADAALLEIDFHYQIDSLGSNEEYVKY